MRAVLQGRSAFERLHAGLGGLVGVARRRHGSQDLLVEPPRVPGRWRAPLSRRRARRWPQAKGGNRAPFLPGCCATGYFGFGLQEGCPHPQGFLPSAHVVEQNFLPRTSTDASLQEHAPLLHPTFASFSVPAISTSMRHWSLEMVLHGACHCKICSSFAETYADRGRSGNSGRPRQGSRRLRRASRQGRWKRWRRVLG
jgi:hypothetical protein